MAAAIKRKRKARRAVVLLFLLAVSLSLFLYDQNNRLDVSDISVSSSRLPAAFSGFRIVLLSDGHGKSFGPNNEALLEAVRRAKPDIIVYTGDIIDKKEQLSSVPSLARGLSQIAPSYYVSGNHEWAVREMPALFALLEENGVTPLRNTYVPLTRDGAAILLCGVDDPNGPYGQKTPAALFAETRADRGDCFSVLLAHRNSLFPDYAACGFDLVLSGHGHGGIFRLPWTDGLFGTEHHFFPTYTNGLYALGSSQLVASRGLGNVGRSFRLFNRPHVPVVVLSPASP
ncbi:MAG: metallophosphoesterase [Oscillospiraceae bacterium]|jgi:predicted MPP superfamily phosphohydrolase